MLKCWRVQHKSKCVRLVADFLGIPLNDALEEVVLQQTSKESMVANFSKYDDHPLKRNTNAAAGLPPDAGVGVVGLPRCGHPTLPAHSFYVHCVSAMWFQIAVESSA